MSGHSHFATIKRAKEAKDAQKGKAFSKHARAISIAVKAGGGPDPSSNYKLRMAIDAARADNTPKENIDRAISKASSEAENLEEYAYEGFGPYGISVIVEAATDNRNRTAQELKNLFEKGGGNMGSPGSVAYNFESKGMIKVQKSGSSDALLLDLIDLGVDDYEESGNELILYTPFDKTGELRDKIAAKKYNVISAQPIKKAKNFLEINDIEKARKIFSFVDKLEEHDDVQNVYTNIDVTDEVLNQL
jgi:YebC/PmpR family DNA-binding regulatory protein